MDTVVVDEAKAELFAERIVEILNGGALAVMTSLGHRSGLFDAMESGLPMPCVEIAERAGLNERYVREWLGAMVTGGFVDYDAQTARYRLPPEHAAFLTRGAAPDNLAALAQYISVVSTVEDDVLHCFRFGGGVPYARFPRFHEVMAEDSGQTVLPALIPSILPLVPGLTRKLEEGIDVLDAGCGRGLALLLLAEAFPASRFTGYDLSEEATSAANADARERGLTNVRFAVRDLATLEERERYDLVTGFDVVHDQAEPARVLENFRNALRPGGTFLMQDIRGSRHLEKNLDHPIAPLLYTLSTMHCMTVSLAADGAGLGTMWGVETAMEMLEAAGFEDTEVHELPHDIQNVYYVNRRPA